MANPWQATANKTANESNLCLAGTIDRVRLYLASAPSSCGAEIDADE
jgi:hypothetical protein